MENQIERQFEYQPNVAGYITYQPYTSLDEDMIDRLRHAMIKDGVLEDPENPTTIADWVFVKRAEDGPIEVRSRVVLFMDGGDDGEPGFILLRIDEQIDRTKRDYFYHIVDSQPFALYNKDWSDDRYGKKIRELTRYVNAVMRGPFTMWKTLPE